MQEKSWVVGFPLLVPCHGESKLKERATVMEKLFPSMQKQRTVHLVCLFLRRPYSKSRSIWLVERQRQSGMVANVRGKHIGSGSTDTRNGKMLKTPPVTPSILDCCIIRVDYSLAVYSHIPGAKKLMLELPVVIGTLPYSGFGRRNSRVTSQFSMDMSWLALALPEQPEAPPNYADVVSEEEFCRHFPPSPQPPDCEGEACYSVFASASLFRG